jgi:hypothetical protein
MWKGSGRSLRQTLVLENFKFAWFILVPIATASIFYNDAIVRTWPPNLCPKTCICPWQAMH